MAVYARVRPETPPGYFGKLPWAGDFPHARLPAGLRDALDRASRQLLLARAQRDGAGWQDAFLDGPAWAFFMPAAARDPHAWLGLWLPSEDRVGRCFGFSVAVPLSPAPAPAPDATGCGDTAPAVGAEALCTWLGRLDTGAGALERLACPLPACLTLPWASDTVADEAPFRHTRDIPLRCLRLGA